MKRTVLFCLVLAAAFFAAAAPARTEPAVLGGIGECLRRWRNGIVHCDDLWQQ